MNNINSKLVCGVSEMYWWYLERTMRYTLEPKLQSRLRIATWTPLHDQIGVCLAACISFDLVVTL